MDQLLKVEIKEEVDDKIPVIKTETDYNFADEDSNKVTFQRFFEFKNDGSIMTVEIPGEVDIPIILQNCVMYTDIHTPLDLVTINARLRGAEYDPRSPFKAITVKLVQPPVTVRLFGSGKIMSFGAKTENDGFLSIMKILRVLQKLGYKILEDQKSAICNLVATCDLKSIIRLEKLTTHFSYCSSYEPEIFPALVLRMEEPKITLLIFANGKIVLVGAKNREDIKNSIKVLYPTLKSFLKQQYSANCDS